MSNTPFLDFHEQCISGGSMPSNGLCSHFKYHPVFQMVDPEEGDYETYWGADNEDDEFRRWYEYTELRQTVVLLCAAMNNEF